MGALGDGVWAAVVAVEQAVQGVHGGGAHDVAVLENAGIVESIRVGRECHYEFDPKPINEMKSYLDQVSRQWDEALGRLKAFVER